MVAGFKLDFQILIEYIGNVTAMSSFVSHICVVKFCLVTLHLHISCTTIYYSTVSGKKHAKNTLHVSYLQLVYSHGKYDLFTEIKLKLRPFTRISSSTHRNHYIYL